MNKDRILTLLILFFSLWTIYFHCFNTDGWSRFYLGAWFGFWTLFIFYDIFIGWGGEKQDG